MERFWSVIIGLVLLSAVLPSVSRAEERWDLDAQQSDISFAGRSTLHAFEGEALQMSGDLSIGQHGDALETAGRVVVAADKLDTKNAKRDANMKKMLGVVQFPEIAFNVTGLDVPPSDGEERVCRLKGELSIAGKSKSVETEGQCSRSQDRLSIKGAFDVSLAQYALRPPSVIGVIRVADRVRVDFDVTFLKHIAKE